MIPLLLPIGLLVPVNDAVNVPPIGVVRICTGEALSQKGKIGLMVGVGGFTPVIPNVLVIGQFTTLGVTTMV